jgi:hypothetical protein
MVILINIAVVLGIVLLPTLPQATWTPLVIALGIALVFGFSVELALRLHRRHQRSPVVRRAWPASGALRVLGDEPVPDHERSPLDDGSAVPRPRSLRSVSGLLAAISALLVMVAFLVPPEQRAGFAILGLGGLFVARLAAFHPRGAWRLPTPSSGVSARRLGPTLYVSPGDRRNVTASEIRRGRLHGYGLPPCDGSWPCEKNRSD